VATFVIVHGAGDRGSSWDLVSAELRERGRDVVAPDLPSEDEAAGWWDYAETVVEAIGDRGDLVVVAHSLGGFTAPLVCARVPVETLVLVTAMIPAPGERAGDWWSNTGHPGVAYDDPVELYLQDVPADVAAAALADERDQAERPMLEPWPLEAWPQTPTRFLVCRDDRCHPADWMRGVVRERLGIEADEIDGGHCPYLSRPRELADYLERVSAA
jgi:Alpha/beta hydrolase family